MTRVSTALASVGALSVVAGAVVLWGGGVALLAAGGLSLVGAVLFYDPLSGSGE
jgi:hypothetical protein